MLSTTDADIHSICDYGVDGLVRCIHRNNWVCPVQVDNFLVMSGKAELRISEPEDGFRHQLSQIQQVQNSDRRCNVVMPDVVHQSSSGATDGLWG